MDWHDNKNDYGPFVRYCLGIVTKAYNAFEERVAYLQHRGLSKPERIKVVIERKIGKITKRDIMEACPDISKVTIERTLSSFVKSGYLVKTGGGRSSAYGKTGQASAGG